MMRLSLLLLTVLGIVALPACQRKFLEPSRENGGGAAQAPASAAGLPETKGKPDKVSEEPTGLPGYPLVCRPRESSSTDGTEALVHCFLADTDGQPAKLKETPKWTASVSGGATVTQQLQPDQSVFLLIKVSVRDQLAQAVDSLQVTVAIAGQTKTASGKDLPKPTSKRLKVTAACTEFFTLYFTDQFGPYSTVSMLRFDGCEQMAQRVQNLDLPNGATRNLPDLHKTIQTTCDAGVLSIKANQPAANSSLSQTLFAEECEDLKGILNNAGI